MRLFIALIYVVAAIIRVIAELVNRHRVNKDKQALTRRRQPGRTPRQDAADRLRPVDKVAHTPDPVLHHDRAISAAKCGDYSQAISECNLAIALNPKYADAYYLRGLIRYREGDRDSAIEDYERAITVDPDHTDALDSCAGALTTRAGDLHLKGDHNRAITDCNRVIGLKPNDAYAYLVRAWAKESTGDCDGAIDDYDVAAVLDPGDASIFFHRGLTKRILMGDNSESNADFLRAVALDPEYGPRVMEVLDDEPN